MVTGRDCSGDFGPRQRANEDGWDEPIDLARRECARHRPMHRGTHMRQPISCAGELDHLLLSKKYIDEMVPFIKDYFNAAWVIPRRDGVVIRSMGGQRASENEANPDKRLLRSWGAGYAHFDYTTTS